jgi:hypothetical protein
MGSQPSSVVSIYILFQSANLDRVLALHIITSPSPPESANLDQHNHISITQNTGTNKPFIMVRCPPEPTPGRGWYSGILGISSLLSALNGPFMGCGRRESAGSALISSACLRRLHPSVPSKFRVRQRHEFYDSRFFHLRTRACSSFRFRVGNTKLAPCKCSSLESQATNFAGFISVAHDGVNTSHSYILHSPYSADQLIGRTPPTSRLRGPLNAPRQPLLASLVAIVGRYSISHASTSEGQAQHG